MKLYNFYYLILFFFFSFSAIAQNDNHELQKMYDEDQKARSSSNIDWFILSKQDKEREKRVYEMIDAGLIKTGKDYYNSAMIFQHGNSLKASDMAVKQMRKAIELDSTINKWLLAAAIDRDLMRKNKPQIYGTQYVKDRDDTKWTRYTIDSTQVTDEQRKEFNVETLAEQIEKERIMNLSTISEFYFKSNSIKQTLDLIHSEISKGINSTYDVTENGLNSFGYELLYSNKANDALEIFKLNTQLHPNGYNTFDSLGECLMILGKKEEGIAAYKKSLELNPKNENARKIINDQK